MHSALKRSLTHTRSYIPTKNTLSTSRVLTMPSSKGNPTDPELREQLKEEIKQEPNKSGGGQGQWSAWKVSSMTDLFLVDVST